MNRPFLLVLALAPAACDGTVCPVGSNDPACAELVTDVHIDRADENNPVNSSETRMCVNTDGHVYVIWTDDRRQADRKDIWMNRALTAPENPDSWLALPIRVNQGNKNAEGEGHVSAPDIYCDERGVYVVWVDDRDGLLQNGQIYFNRSTDRGDTFLTEDVLVEVTDTEGATDSIDPQITGSGNTLFVAWQDNINGAYDIYGTISSDGGLNWRTPLRIDRDVPAGGAFSARPDIAISRDGQLLHAVWEDTRNGAGSDIYYNRSADGGVQWSFTDQRLDWGDLPGSHSSFEPAICTDGLLNVYSAWHDARNDVDNRDILYAYSQNGGEAWNVGPGRAADDPKDDMAAQRLNTDPPGSDDSRFVDCVADTTSGHFFWTDDRNGAIDLFYRKVNGGTVPAFEEVRMDRGANWERDGGEDARGHSDDFVIGHDPVTGALAVAWIDTRHAFARGADPSLGYSDLYYQYMSDNGTPQNRDFRIDSGFDGYGFKVDLQFAVLGNRWYAAWTDGRDTTSGVYFQSMPLGEEGQGIQVE